MQYKEEKGKVDSQITNVGAEEINRHSSYIAKPLDGNDRTSPNFTKYINQ